jgi:hypothetical protein
MQSGTIIVDTLAKQFIGHMACFHGQTVDLKTYLGVRGVDLQGED